MVLNLNSAKIFTESIVHSKQKNKKFKINIIGDNTATALAGFHAGPSICWSNCNLEVVVFQARGKSEYLQKNPESKRL